MCTTEHRLDLSRMGDNTDNSIIVVVITTVRIVLAVIVTVGIK